MINFLNAEDVSSPISDINKEEERLSYEDKLLNEINQGMEDGLKILELSDKLDYSLAGLEHYTRILPVYTNAYEIVNNNLAKVLDYDAGIEDNLDLDNVFKQAEYVTKALNIKIVEFDAGLLSNDPDDKVENENILLRILKKIWEIIVTFIKGIINFISKIISTFFKFIKRLLGFKDPAAEVKNKLKEKEKKSTGGGGSGFFPSTVNVPSTPTYSSGTPSQQANTSITNNSNPVEDSVNEETIEATDTIEEQETITMDPKQELALSKKMEDKLENMAIKVIEEYPLAVVVADYIYEFEDGEIDLLDLMAVLYLITISSTSAVINCEKKNNYTIERHLGAFLNDIKQIEDIFKREDHLNGRQANNNYFDTATYYRLFSFVETVYPLYTGKQSSNESMIALIRNIMKGYSGNLTVASDTMYFHLTHLKDRFKTVNTNIDFNSIFNPILEDKLGEEFVMGMKDYVPVTSKLKDNGLTGSYKYFRSAVLSFNKKEIELLVHLTNIASYENYIKNLNLPDPGMISSTHKSAESIEKEYMNFFKNILPELAKEAKGELQIIKIEVTEKDIKKFLPATNKKIIAIAPFMNEDKLVTIKILDYLSQALGTNADSVEKCLKYTEKDLKEIGKHIRNTETLLDKFIKHMGTQRAIVNRGEPRARYDLEATDVPADERRTPKETLAAKQALISSLRKGILTTSQTLQATSSDLLKIYKNVVVPNLKNIRTLTTEKVITKFINELIDYYEAKDGVKG